MLKGIDPLLSPELLGILRAMGHGDEIAIVDGNYPADAHAQRLVRADGLSATAVLDAVLALMPLDDFVPETCWVPVPIDGADPNQPIFAEFQAIIDRREPGFKLAALKGQGFYDRVKAAYCVVGTSERRLYGNVVLRKGVIRPDK